MSDLTTPVALDKVAESELVSRFVRESEAVGCRVLRARSPGGAAERIAQLAREARARSAAVGPGIATDLGTVAAALESGGIAVVRTGMVEDRERSALRDRFAGCDLGVAEAGYGVAASGTLAVAADADRPAALTLLPPISVVVILAERIVADLAALFERVGPAGARANRLILITGPSRTADIEKRIVLGVHGPRELCVVLIESGDG